MEHRLNEGLVLMAFEVTPVRGKIYEQVLGREEFFWEIPGPKRPHQLPKVLSETIYDNSAALYGCTAKSIEPNICFDSLITDSRCPKPAVCFWSGTAIIKISFHERGNVHTFKMSLKDFPSLGYPNDTTIAGYRIVFTGLTPYPDFNAPAPQASDIRATFNITH